MPESAVPPISNRAQRLDDGLLFELERPSALVRRSVTLVFRHGRLEVPAHSITIPYHALSIRLDGGVLQVEGHRIRRQWHLVDPEPLAAAWSVLRDAIEADDWSRLTIEAAYAAFVRMPGAMGDTLDAGVHHGVPVRWTPEGAEFALEAAATTQLPAWVLAVPILAAAVLVGFAPLGPIAIAIASSLVVMLLWFSVMLSGGPPRRHRLEVRGRQLLLDGESVAFESLEQVAVHHGRLALTTADRRLTTDHLANPGAVTVLAKALSDVAAASTPDDTDEAEHRAAMAKLMQRT